MGAIDTAANGREILGIGWQFPVRIGPAGRSGIGAPVAGGIALARYEEDIEQAIRIILGTRPGERRMRPEFGCRVHELTFEPDNPTTHGLMERYVREALEFWEPRIEVTSVTVAELNQSGWVDIEVQYSVEATKDERSLVYPFYVIGVDG